MAVNTYRPGSDLARGFSEGYRLAVAEYNLMLARDDAMKRIRAGRMRGISIAVAAGVMAACWLSLILLQ